MASLFLYSSTKKVQQYTELFITFKTCYFTMLFKYE